MAANHVTEIQRGCSLSAGLPLSRFIEPLLILTFPSWKFELVSVTLLLYDTDVSTPYTRMRNRMDEDTSKSVVISEFRDTWAAYYAWEPSFCKEKISALRAPSPLLKTTTHDAFEDLIEPLETPPTPDAIYGPTCTRYMFDESGTATAHAVDIETISAEPLPHPHAPYESCTPVSWNILHGDDPSYMPFVPYADDPTFAIEDWSYEHKGLAWQESYRDSDGEHVTSLTARPIH